MRAGLADGECDAGELGETTGSAAIQYTPLSGKQFGQEPRGRKIRVSNSGPRDGATKEVPAEHEKCYFSTAMREFKLTKHRIECAIGDGIIDVLAVRNPHYKSGPPARMLYRHQLRAYAKIEQSV